MDEIDGLLQDLAREEMPEESLRRVAAGVQGKLRRRRFTQWALAAAALCLCSLLALDGFKRGQKDEIPLPALPPAVFPAPELALPPPARLPSVSHQKPRRSLPRVVGEGVVQLPSKDPNVVILWDLKETQEGGGLL
jgi:hypothetical protein